MADHRELTVINALISKITGLSSTGTNIELEREYPWPGSTEKALTVRLGAEEEISRTWPYVDAWATANITLIYKGPKASAMAAIAAMRAEINTALMAYDADGSDPLGLAFVTALREAGAGDVVAMEADETQWEREIIWQAWYRRSVINPTT